MEIISIELIVDQIENLYVIQNLYVEYLKPVCSKKSYFKIVNGSLKHEIYSEVPNKRVLA